MIGEKYSNSFAVQTTQVNQRVKSRLTMLTDCEKDDKPHFQQTKNVTECHNSIKTNKKQQQRHNKNKNKHTHHPPHTKYPHTEK